MKLTTDQLASLQVLNTFLFSDQEELILSGYAGCGKSTLIDTFLKSLPSLYKTRKLLFPDYVPPEIRLCASTNKAAGNLEGILNQEVTTIHSAFGLRVITDYRTGETQVVPKTGDRGQRENILWIIDEVSSVDQRLLTSLKKQCTNCKFLFIGDSAQLTIRNGKPIIFHKGIPETKLTQVVRQQLDSPITTLATMLRKVVNGKDWEKIVLASPHIIKVDPTTFDEQITKVFKDPTANTTAAKILTWTNKAAIGYNQFIKSQQNLPNFQVGDRVVCNTYIRNRLAHIPTDAEVHITKMVPTTYLGIQGNNIRLEDFGNAFLPDDPNEVKLELKRLRKGTEWDTLKQLATTWVDLRHPYASTINKAQGSTYDKVFIDLDDVGKCKQPNTLARLLYVAVSRAKYEVIFTGNL